MFIGIIFTNILHNKIVYLPRSIIGSCVVNKNDWIISAVGEHVIAQFALAGGDKSVGVEEAAEVRIVISALQIIEPQLFGCKYAIVPFFSVEIVSCYPRL